jgi:hypothetical protein
MQPALAAFRQVSQTLATIGPALTATLRAALPPNWNPDEFTFRGLQAVAIEDGIPIAWVPHADVVTNLMRAPDRAARLRVLLSSEGSILRDCRSVLREIQSAGLADRKMLAAKVVRAYAAGHREAAQTLAVVVSESLITEFVAGGAPKGAYRIAKDQARMKGAAAIRELRRGIALAPIERFYTEWYPSSGQPAPAGLSRHVTIHQATLDHFSRSNALLAVMLMTSLLREFQQAKMPTPHKRRKPARKAISRR